MMSAAKHHRPLLRFAAMALCFVFAVASAPAWLVEGLCKEICCTSEQASAAPANKSCCPTVVPEPTESHEHRPAPCPLSWCCEQGDFTPILQSPPSLRDQHDRGPVDASNQLLALDEAFEEHHARRFVAAASPPKPAAVPVWLSHSSLLI